jgi:hypothetical protein
MMAAFVTLAATATSAQAGKIVVNHDDWTFRDVGFTNASPDTTTFALNIASYFAGGGSGNFLAYSNNPGLTGSTLANTMTSAGHSWTANISVPFTLANLMNYDAVFLTGNPGAFNATVLIDYVNGGGSVYIGGGSGYGSAAIEAANWNAFLNPFSLGFDATNGYNMVSGNRTVDSNLFLVDGVDKLYYANGLTVERLQYDPHARVFSYTSGFGALALYDSERFVPEAGTLALGATGLGLLGLTALRRGRRPA